MAVTATRPDEAALLAFIDEQHDRLMKFDATVPPDKAATLAVLFGPCAQAIRFSTAFASLARTGFSREAVALARQAFEHAVTAQWAFFHDDGITVLRDELRRSSRQFFERMGTYLSNDDLLAATAKKFPQNPNEGRLPRVVDRLNAFDNTGMLDQVYFQQSQLVHVTGTSSNGFVTGGDVYDGVDINPAPQDPYQSSTVYVAAMATMFAAWVLEMHIDGAPGLARLEEQSDELQLPIHVEDPPGWTGPV